MGGALTEGRSVVETAVKEGAEEAGLTEQLATGKYCVIKDIGELNFVK